MSNARVFAQQVLSYVPHTDASGEAWQLIKRGTCTSAGASGGTTLVDTNGDSAGADAYNGRYWVRILSGDLKDQWARVVDDNGSGTLTLEADGFPAQVASGVEYEIYKSPEPVLVIDSSSGATNAVDAERVDEVDDFWKDFWVLPITGNRRGEKAKVTGFTKSSGTFVLGSGLSGALAAGDVCLLRKFVEVAEPAPSLTDAYTARPQQRTNFSRGDGVVGPRGGTISFRAQVVASGALAAADSKANASVLAALIEAGGFDEVIGTSCDIEASSTTSLVRVTTGQGARVRPGMMVIYNGNPTWVTSTSQESGYDAVNVSPPLPNAPAASDTLYATRMYERSQDGDVRAVCIDLQIDGIRTTMTGCKGNVSLNDGVVAEAAFELNVDHWIRELCPWPGDVGSAYSNAQPVQPSDRAAWLDATRFDVSGFTTSPNTATAERPVQGADGVNGRSGFQVVDYAAAMTYRRLLDADGALVDDQRFWARTSMSVAVAYGSHGNCFASRSPVGRLIEVPTPANANGLVDVPNVIEPQDAGTAPHMGTTVKVPDYAWHLS